LAKIFVYNPKTKSIETYYRGLSEPMPYVSGRTMTVREFKSNSISNILWTDKRMIDSWNGFRKGWGKPIYIGFAFKRIWEGGHSPQSQHYPGMALDIGQTLPREEREKLRTYAKKSGYWSYVGSQASSPRWVHVDDRYGISACWSGGYPTLRVGSKGVYVFVLQDALIALGFISSQLDGIFGSRTRNAVINFQASQGLPLTGIVDCNTWNRLTRITNGVGITPTTII